MPAVAISADLLMPYGISILVCYALIESHDSAGSKGLTKKSVRIRAVLSLFALIFISMDAFRVCVEGYCALYLILLFMIVFLVLPLDKHEKTLLVVSSVIVVIGYSLHGGWLAPVAGPVIAFYTTRTLKRMSAKN
jgi:hypothetical protein